MEGEISFWCPGYFSGGETSQGRSGALQIGSLWPYGIQGAIYNDLSRRLVTPNGGGEK